MSFKKIINKQLGEILLERNLITKPQLERGLAVQKEKGGLIGEVLVALGYVQEQDITQALISQYGFPYLPLNSYEIDPDVIKIFPAQLVREYLVIPVDKYGKNVTVTMGNPLDSQAIEYIEAQYGVRLQTFISTATDIRNAIEKYYPLKK
jgi:type IV pilus assembly protein PilB